MLALVASVVWLHGFSLYTNIMMCAPVHVCVCVCIFVCAVAVLIDPQAVGVCLSIHTHGPV